MAANVDSQITKPLHTYIYTCIYAYTHIICCFKDCRLLPHFLSVLIFYLNYGMCSVLALSFVLIINKLFILIINKLLVLTRSNIAIAPPLPE